jgi:restriction system protein
MPIPTFDGFIEPLLRYLADHPEGARTAEVYEAIAAKVGLTEQEREELLPSGTQVVYQNRIGWAHNRLKHAGYSSSPRRGFWQITDTGRAFVKEHPSPLSEPEIERLARVERSAYFATDESSAAVTGEASIDAAGARSQSPEERIEAALADLRDSAARDLLEQIGRASPRFFEGLVLDLLHAMGYGTSRADLQQVGGSGDGGIDGIISLDRLGLEKVYVQAKRWQASVGRPEVQSFYGALRGRHANKGVFLTTSTFTREAHEFARQVADSIVLIDGARLTALMIEHGVGVSHKALKIPKVDSDYFEGE